MKKNKQTLKSANSPDKTSARVAQPPTSRSKARQGTAPAAADKQMASSPSRSRSPVKAASAKLDQSVTSKQKAATTALAKSQTTQGKSLTKVTAAKSCAAEKSKSPSVPRAARATRGLAEASKSVAATRQQQKAGAGLGSAAQAGQKSSQRSKSGGPQASAAPTSAKNKKASQKAAKGNDLEDKRVTSDTIIYKAGSTICFVNGEEEDETRYDHFCIGQVALDMREGDSRVLIHRYYREINQTSKSLVTYEREDIDEPQPILDFQVLGEIAAGHLEFTKDFLFTSLKKSAFTRFNNTFKNAVDGVMERLGDGAGDEDKDGSDAKESESDDEEMEDEAAAHEVVEESKVATKPKRSAKSPKQTTSKIGTKAATKVKKQEMSSEEEADGEQDEEYVEVEKRAPFSQPVIGKRKKAAASASLLKKSAAPQKRARREADEQEDSASQASDDFKPAPKGKKPAAKKPAQPKRPTVFKAGKWNPDTELVEEENEKCSKSLMPSYTCCKVCNLRNLHRAVNIRDPVLLKKLVMDKLNIAHFSSGWSDDDKETIVSKIVVMNDLKLLDALFPVQEWTNKKHLGRLVDQHTAMTQFFGQGNRTHIKQYLLHKINTGSVSKKAYGTAIRAVNVTRGNRQGNNAFNENPGHHGNMIPQISNQFTTKDAIFTFKVLRDLKSSFYKKFQLVNPHNPQLTASLVALTGNRKLVASLVQPKIKFENYGFNKLHLDVLQLDELTEKYATQSITKKAVSDNNVTPLHFAAINPNKEVIKKLLEQNMELNTMDNLMHKPIHFAACCESSGPLEVLLDKGGNVFDLDSNKMSPLHYAAINGRADNIRVILKNQRQAFKLRDRQNMTAFAYALALGEIEPIKAFLDSGVVKINAGQGPDRMSPLSWAASLGKYELCEWLLSQKARTLTKDKFKRTPLIMAVKNGHVKIASLLLQHGSEWNHADSSQNSVLHYAAGFGWKECIDLLIKHGADINAANMWKITPITIAMLKNHQGIVKELLKRDDIDVNGKDEDGRTLLTMAIADLSDPTVLEFVQFLVEKGADPAITDTSGNTCLHRLATYTSQIGHSNAVDYKEKKRREMQTLVKVTKFLIEKGAPLQALNSEKNNAFTLALNANNTKILDILAESIKLSESPSLLFAFSQKIYDDRYKSILIKLIKRENSQILTEDKMNTLDSEGFTPFLTYIKSFVENRDSLMQKVGVELSYQEYLHKERTENYVIRNIDLFKSRAAKDQAYQQHYRNSLNPAFISVTDRQDLQFKFFYTLVIQEFVKFLQILIDNGANPHAKVQKLEFYRKLDEYKQHLFKLEEQRAANQLVQDVVMQNAAPNMINTMAPAASANVAAPVNGDANAVKTRKEVLAEQQYEKKASKKQKHKNSSKRKAGKDVKDKDGGDDPNDPQSKIKKQVKEFFYAKQGFNPQFETKDGKQVELEYSKQYGQQGAMHLIMRYPTLWIVQYFLNQLNLEYDAPDYRNRTPFSIGIDFQIEKSKHELEPAVKLLITQGANIDYPDEANQTPFLKLYEHRLNDICNILLDKGANINQMSKKGIFALKIALMRRDDKEIKRLHSLGADINQLDHDQRNLLHYAINMSSSSADATFETEQFLIDLGVKVNVRDCHGRVPLHYAFVKMKDWNNASAIDPIETVSSLCAIKDLEIEVPDKWLKTPLHYAAQRSATISSLYILQRGAQLESKDIYGNTPLGISLLRNHFNYGIILIQKSANVTVPVHKEFPRRIAKQWADELKAKAGEGAAEAEADDVEMMEDGDSKKKHRNMFNTKGGMQYNMNNALFGAGVSSDDSDYDSESDDSSDSQGVNMEVNVMTSQNYFNANFGNIYGRQQRQNRMRNQFGFNQLQQHQNKVESDASDVEPVQAPWSTFRTAIHAGQQGIAYLILDNGYDYMLAMQDALDEQKFQLFLTLIQKTADDAVVQKKNDKGQNLMHILAINSQSSSNQLQIILRIFNTLEARGVDCKSADNLNCNALHYAVKCHAIELVNLLLQNNIDCNLVNNEGHSPLTLALKGATPFALTQVNSLTQPIWKLLLQKGADTNLLYPEDSHKGCKNGLSVPPLAEGRKSSKKRESAPSKDEPSYKCTILINYAKHNKLSEDHMLGSFRILLNYGARFDLADSDGLTVLEHAIINNNYALVNFILANKQAAGLVIDHRQPATGRTAVHTSVKPLEFGSYENLDILRCLKTHGFNLSLPDAEGKTPLDYAMEQDSKVMAKEICKLLNTHVDYSVSLRRNSLVPADGWPHFEYSFTDDAATFLDEAEKKRAKEVFEKEQELDYVPIDREFAAEKQYKVYYDSETRKPWDAYMTKVDLRNGPYGDYVYYKMQIIFDSNRELYIVLTRYGSIGEHGMHQRTPFNDVEEAKKEFRTIFKQKSGNEWEAPEFVPQRKKYELTQVNYSNVKLVDYLAPFDFENCAKGSGLSKAVENLIEEISNVSMYHKAIQGMGIDESKLPVSAIKREAIKQAYDILKQLSTYTTKLAQLRTQGMRADFDEIMAVMSQLSDLSSKYYQLVPKKVAEHQIMKPIKEQHELQAEYQVLDQLVNVEQISRILLAGLYRQYTINPIEYIYKSLGVNIELLEDGTPECDLIKAYCLNTSMSEHSNTIPIKRIRIFKIERKGEQEQFEQVAAEIGNRKLLFHGSGISNFLGLLSQGMRIAPPEVPTTGFMFGKGCYFADMMSKSLSYSSGYKSRLLLLCDVALGKEKKLYRAEYVEKLEAGFHSVKGCGRYGPDFHKRRVVSPQGFSLPMGPPIQYPEPSLEVQNRVNGTQVLAGGGGLFGGGGFRFGGGGLFGGSNFYHLQHNEYIVYETQQIRQRYIVQVETQ